MGSSVKGAAIALFLFGVMVNAAAAQKAEDLAGTWQGRVGGGDGARVVLTIQRADGGGWKGEVRRLDQEEANRAVAAMTLQGGALTFAVTSIDVNFTGKVSADGATITGDWRVGGKSNALTLARATSDTAWEVEQVKRMAKDADPSFDVATVKPSDPKNGSQGFHSGNGRRINCDNETLDDLISFVYGVHSKQILSAPDWASTQRWDVDGYPDVPGEPNYRQMQGMYRKLLEDRFGLKMHRDTKDLAAYVISVAKSGSKLTKSADQEAMSDTSFLEWNSQRMVLRVSNTTMAEFMWAMDFVLERPVVDQTGLTGKWDFLLKWRPDNAPDTNDTSALPPLAQAMQEQAGLRMEKKTAATEVLVIDHVEKPGQN